ncbi:MAG: hypothetical protein KBD24_02335 [Candidatus Pacebacteria bacterium]|nr:hypothetical protein [Candidatus Paceibacterota bacterium]
MIITLTGPSGVGKGHLTTQLQSAFAAKIIPWITTRPLRLDDVATNNRCYVTHQEFDLMQKEGLLVNVQNLHGEKYGLEKKFINLSEQSGIYICEINSTNVLTLFPLLCHRFSVALVTDNLQLLKERIVRREPIIGHEQLADRLKIAVTEVELIRINASLFHLQINVDMCHESIIASTVIEAIKKV